MKPIIPGRLSTIKGMLERLNFTNHQLNPAKGWEMSWTYANELLHHVEYLERGLTQVATANLTDMPPAAKAMVVGIQDIARRHLNGE